MKQQRAYEHVAVGEAPFYIPAVGSPSRPRRTLKHNETFAVFDSHGDIGSSTGSADGLFSSDTRLLSHLELLIDGARPLLLHSSVHDDNLRYSVDLTNPDHYRDGRLLLAKDTIHIARALYIYEDSLRQRVSVSNYGPETARFTITFTFASDFADIFEVRGVSRPRRGTIWSEVEDDSSVLLSYRGLDGVVRTTCVGFEPTPAVLHTSATHYNLELEPGARCSIYLVVARVSRQSKAILPFFRGLLHLGREVRSGTANAATVETGNAIWNEILMRARADFYMLTTDFAEGRYPCAGIPWYSTTFGRDAIIAAMQMLWMDPAIAAGVLRRLAALQASGEQPDADASPGKILHEMRGGEMSSLGETPFARYYGSVDATPLFVMLAGAYLDRTGDVALVESIWPAIEKAIGWIESAGDADGDGFVEYQRALPTGLANQGWKDSHDAVFHADGALAHGPIALVEVQAYVYAAYRAAAICARRLGHAAKSAEHLRRAAELQERFERAFWSEAIGTYVLALDGEKMPCGVRTSNPGHALLAGIASPERARRIAATLLRAPYFSGWGIRTVARGEARYNPMSYHNGSVWPHDNAIIGMGLARYGMRPAVEAILDPLMRAASYMEHRRIPELYCGFRRRQGQAPTLYPAACSPQAWAAAAPFALIGTMLGLRFDDARRTVTLDAPCVPIAAGEITVRNLRLRDARIDFTARAAGRGVAIEILASSGDVTVELSGSRRLA